MRELSAAAAKELRQIGIRPGRGTSRRILSHAAAVERLRSWCRQALSRAHLVHVARALCESLGTGTGLAELRGLGLPIDVLELFPAWRSGSRAGFTPQSLGLRPVPAGAADPLGTLRLQLSPVSGTVPYALLLLRGLLRRLDPAVRFVVVVQPGANIQALRRLVGELGAGRRVRLVELESATVWAQDNARAAHDAQGRPALLIPREFRRGKSRADDAIDPVDARRALGARVVRSALYWEGGNLLHDEGRAFIGADAAAESMARLGLTQAEVLRLFAAELGTEVTVLGDVSRARIDVKDANEGTVVRSGQASFHIDLDVALLGRVGRSRKPVALLADPARGLDLLPAVLRHRPLLTGHFLGPRRVRDLLAAEYQAYARERHALLLSYCETLEGLGYRVVGVPDLRIDPKENVFGSTNLNFTYCNVLPGLRRGRPTVHYLPWGIRALDEAAELRFHAAGVTPVRASTSGRLGNALMQLQGGLHCCCGPMPER